MTISGNNIKALTTVGVLTGLISNIIALVTGGVLVGIPDLISIVEYFPSQTGGGSAGGVVVDYRKKMFRSNFYTRDRFHRRRSDVFHKKIY